MNSAYNSIQAAPAQPVSVVATGLRNAGLVVAGSLLIAASAHLSIPLFFTPVPVTMQPFAVLLLGLLMGPRLAFATMLAYLAEGAAGLPVFTPHGLGGVAQLLGPTGGYLLSYPIVAPLVSVLWRRGQRTFSRAAAVAALGSLITLAMGATWLAMATHLGPSAILASAVLPFLPGDVLKVVLAAGICSAAQRWRTR